jgi:potassium efflux system protein
VPLVLAAVLGWALGTAGAIGRAQAPAVPPTAASEAVTAQRVKDQMQAVELATDLTAEQKTKAQEIYRQALDALDLAAKHADQAARMAADIRTVDARMADLRERLDALPRQPTILPEAGASLEDLRKVLAQKQVELQQAITRRGELEAQKKQRDAREPELPKLIDAAKARLADIERQLQAAPPPDEPATLAAAKGMLRLAQRQAAEQEIRSLQQEMALYRAEAPLLPLQQEYHNAVVKLLEAEVKQWRDLVDQRHAQEVAAQERRAALEKALADPALKHLAERNAHLAEERRELIERMKRREEELAEARQQLEAVQEQFARIAEKVDKVGLTGAIGLLLREARDHLPDADGFRRKSRTLQARIQETQLQLLTYENRLDDLQDLEKQVQLELAAVADAADPHRRAYLEPAVRDLLTTEREFVTSLVVDYNDHRRTLYELDYELQRLITTIVQFQAYIDQRVLWIQSTAALWKTDFRPLPRALMLLTQPQSWIDVATLLAADARDNSLLWFGAAVLLLAWLRAQSRLRSRIRSLGEQATRSTACRFRPTVETLFLTVCNALLYPALLAYVAWRLGAVGDASAMAHGVSAGLRHAAGVFVLLELLRQASRRGGLGEAHFLWPERSLRLLRFHLRWLMLAGIPLAFVQELVRALSTSGLPTAERWHDTLGRLVFLAGMVVLLLFLQRTMHPRRGVFGEFLAYRREGWADRLRYVWFGLVLAAPTALAVLAAIGYFYTAEQLAAKMKHTAGLLVGWLFVGAFLQRWILVVRRRLAFQQAREALAARTAAETEPTGEAVPAPQPEPAIDLSQTDAQTRRMLHSGLVVAALVGLWLIWVNVLPALNVLDDVPLWSTSLEAAEPIDPQEPAAGTRTVTRYEPVTLMDLMLAVLLAVLTATAAANVPGLLEMTLLQRLPLEQGVRFAITTVSRYFITIVGVLLFFNQLGIGWSKVQWLVTALMLGLGFGLQEIFANFVSGLIILLERPIRVGDVVTIGETTGVVSRIRIRATTITNWERKELIVPNREFITGRLLNWTLSDKVNRVEIVVGVAYGSDTERVRELLLEVARSNAYVLSDPPPVATFEGFGDSALRMVLRCYLPSMENRLQAIHELHTAIDKALRAAKIEIAFPQLDIHLRSGWLLASSGGQGNGALRPEGQATHH